MSKIREILGDEAAEPTTAEQQIQRVEAIRAAGKVEVSDEDPKTKEAITLIDLGWEVEEEGKTVKAYGEIAGIDAVCEWGPDGFAFALPSSPKTEKIIKHLLKLN